MKKLKKEVEKLWNDLYELNNEIMQKVKTLEAKRSVKELLDILNEKKEDMINNPYIKLFTLLLISFKLTKNILKKIIDGKEQEIKWNKKIIN